MKGFWEKKNCFIFYFILLEKKEEKKHFAHIIPQLPLYLNTVKIASTKFCSVRQLTLQLGLHKWRFHHHIHYIIFSHLFARRPVCLAPILLSSDILSQPPIVAGRSLSPSLTVSCFASSNKFAKFNVIVVNRTNNILPESKNELSVDKKRQLLEQYGLNPDEYLSEPSPKVSRSLYQPIYFIYFFGKKGSWIEVNVDISYRWP